MWSIASNSRDPQSGPIRHLWVLVCLLLQVRFSEKRSLSQLSQKEVDWEVFLRTRATVGKGNGDGEAGL